MLRLLRLRNLQDKAAVPPRQSTSAGAKDQHARLQLRAIMTEISPTQRCEKLTSAQQLMTSPLTSEWGPEFVVP